MKGLKELRILNYWAHVYESVVFDVDGNITDSKSIDNKGFISKNIFTERSLAHYIDTIIDGELFTDGRHSRLELRYSEPKYKTERERKTGYYLGTLYLSFHNPKNPDTSIGMVINFKPSEDYDSHIIFYLNESNYKFNLSEYTSDIHQLMLSALLREIEGN